MPTRGKLFCVVKLTYSKPLTIFMIPNFLIAGPNFIFQSSLIKQIKFKGLLQEKTQREIQLHLICMVRCGFSGEWDKPEAVYWLKRKAGCWCYQWIILDNGYFFNLKLAIDFFLIVKAFERYFYNKYLSKLYIISFWIELSMYFIFVNFDTWLIIILFKYPSKYVWKSG